MPDEHIVKGYEVSKGQYVVVDPDELEPFIPAATKAIDLEEFVDLSEIDPVFFDTPYIVAPDKAAKPYVLLAKAMEDAGKVAVGTFVMRSKQYVAALRAVDGRLMLSTMAFPDEVVDPATIDELGRHRRRGRDEEGAGDGRAAGPVASGDFEPEHFRDTYREQVLDLIEKKAAGEVFEAPEPVTAAPKVVDLMAALEASVKAAKEARGRHPAAVQAVPARRAEGGAAAADEARTRSSRPKKPARARARKSA